MPGQSSARVAPSKVLLVASLGAFLAFLDATIVNVAFPSIQRSFSGSSIGALSWVLNAYNIVFAAFLVVCGRLTDLIGRRRAYAGGIALFTVASGLCAAAPTLDLLVAGRVVQALGAAMLVPASLALVVEAFPGEKRAHAIGLWGATAAVAAGLGPPLGGALVQLGGWQWAFLVNLPFGAAALVATRRSIVESRAPGRRVLPDIPGALLLAVALALLNLGVVKASDWGWGSTRVLGSFVVAALLALAFVRSSSRHPAPVVDPALVRISSFRMASLATVLAGIGFYSYLLTNILWLQHVWGYGVLRAGLALVPGALVAAVVAARLGPLAERVGYRVLVVPGALVWAGAYVWYRQQVGLEPAFWAEWLPGQLLSGIGVGACLPLLGSAALAAVPGGRYATASALVSSARQLGGVLGISFLVLIVGSPTGDGLVSALRDGWTLAIVSFLLLALVALPIGKVTAGAEEEDADRGVPLVLLPESAPVLATCPHPLSIGLEDAPLLACLPADARAALTSASRTVELEAGAWLFEEGDPAGSAYVLRSGRLEVVLTDGVVRELGPGSVIGELALITGEPRSAGARARRDATLLELPREAFDSILASDAAAMHTMLTQIANQLRTAATPAPPLAPPRPRVVAVVGLHDGSAAAEVAAALVARLSTHLSVVAPGRVDAAGLARAEADHERVVLVADGSSADVSDVEWRSFCRRQSDVVVLVSRTGGDLPTGLATLENQRELVLIGPPASPAERAAWVAATDAWQLTSVDGDVALGVRPLADRLAGRSLGLVLAGGGARAFAHIGILSELEASGYRVDRVAGSSIGAVVAAMHAQGWDAAQVEETMYADFVRRNPFSDWTLPRHSLARGARQRAIASRIFGTDAVIEGLPRQLHVVSTDLITRRRVVHGRGNLGVAVTASARLPILFPPMPTEEGQLLMDGGVLDNLPADVLLRRDEGPVVAVNISMGGSARSRGRVGKPRIPAIGDTLLRTMMIGAGGAVDAAHRLGVAVVTPATMGVGLLEFHQFDRVVESGRRAGRALLESGVLDTSLAEVSEDDPGAELRQSRDVGLSEPDSGASPVPAEVG